MRALLAVFALTMLIPATASADTVGTATTTTGQTLTITIDAPADGVTEYGQTTATMSGHATVTGSGSGSTSVSEVKAGIGDAYEAPGSTEYGASFYPDMSQWNDGYHPIPFEGTRTLYATAIAADGTRATANITITLDPRRKRHVTAYGLLYDDWRGGPTGALEATMDFSRTPYEIVGTPIDFFVKGEKVCTASIAFTDTVIDPWYLAVCRDPVAIAKATAAGGYEARYEGDQYDYPASASAGLVVRQT